MFEVLFNYPRLSAVRWGISIADMEPVCNSLIQVFKATFTQAMFVYYIAHAVQSKQLQSQFDKTDMEKNISSCKARLII